MYNSTILEVHHNDKRGKDLFYCTNMSARKRKGTYSPYILKPFDFNQKVAIQTNMVRRV